jgi:hypothetical protein
VALPTFPAASVERTVNVCDPSRSPDNDLGDEQLVNDAPSRLHSMLPLSAVNVKLAPVADVGLAGCPPVMLTTGAV